MTREIKFRAWDREHNRMIGPLGLADLSYKSDGGTINLKDWDDIANVEDLDWMQYTGLKDKNGRDIYEGDLIYARSCVVPQEVVWDDVYGGWEPLLMPNDGGIPPGESPEDFEVIGNIYENPEIVPYDPYA